ncbi:MAG: hypothetical protein P4N60_11195 [Verrucomicrobiae bacterium]|nr:hypothetical protein [Verrucomicrobiae bacterium]
MNLLNDPLIRAQNPKSGDRFELGDKSAVITAVGDNMVWRVVKKGQEKQRSRVCLLDEYPNLVKTTLEDGATFTPAEGPMASGGLTA